MGIWLALASALSYGTSDFVAGVLSRRAPAVAVACAAQLIATVVVVLAAPFALTGHPTGAALLWGAVAGVGAGLGTAFLYRGFGAGRMSVVAPLSAVMAALLPAIVGIASGERPSVAAVVGMVVALPAIWLVSRTRESNGGRLSAGGVEGLLAGVGFALLFIGLAHVPDGTGLWPLALAQAVSVPVIAALAVSTRTSLRLPPRLVAGAAAVGILGAAATLLYLLATRQALLAVAAVLASLYPALTILLARVLLKERIAATQGVGLACAAAAVSLIAVG